MLALVDTNDQLRVTKKLIRKVNMKLLLVCLSVLALLSCGSTSNHQSTSSEKNTTSSQRNTLEPNALNIVPLPTVMVVQKTFFDIGLLANVQIDTSILSSSTALQKLLADLNITHSSSAPYSIQLQLVNNADLGAEGYTLTIDNNIVISAQTDAGLFYGVQTLTQLLPTTPKNSYTLPQLQITDVPQYAWRGSMIDVARNFFTIEYLKKHVERMALFKLNKLHLHLSDDQGWRVEIKKYPKLTSIGGSTKAGGGDGGFYTQQELKDFVAFAAMHQVDVIPEIDMPGHIQAAIASYNELACSTVTNLGLYTGLAVGFSSLCLTNSTLTYQFVEDVLTELTGVFTSQYLHIGGDEIKNDLYPQFIEKANQIINRLNKTMIGWEESSAGNLTSDSLLQLWNDNYDIKSATDRNIHLILSPCSYTYLDHGNYNGQPDTYTWCRPEGIPLERVYSLHLDKYPLVVGIEAPMWSELVKTEAAADNRMWPRLAAIAELGWSEKSSRHYEQFLLRLSALKPHLDKLGIVYYKEPQLDW